MSELDTQPEAAPAPAPAAEVWPRVVKLRHPVQVGTQSIEQLTFRRGVVGDMKGLKIDDVPPIDHVVLVVSRLCGQPLGVIEKLDSEDAGEVMSIALGFIDRCLTVSVKR